MIHSITKPVLDKVKLKDELWLSAEECNILCNYIKELEVLVECIQEEADNLRDELEFCQDMSDL